MGRFYQTAKPEFVDNFIYQPPWELMMATLQKKEEGIKNQLNEMEFLKSFPIDYIDYDKDLALAEKEKISAQIDNIASNFQKDLLNPNNKYEIQKLKRELQKSATNGTIYNLQKNAESYRKFEAMRNTLSDPNDREKYVKMFENYKNSNKEFRDKGEFGQTFTPEEMYNSVNYWDNFTKSESFKALEPDIKKSKIDKINGAWVVTQGSETKSLEESKIGQAFKNYIQTQPGIKGYAGSREKYFGEKWLDEKGEIDFTKGTLYNMLNEGVPSLSYSQTASSTDRQMNQVWSQLNKQNFEANEAAKNRAFQREQMKAQSSQPLPPDISKDASYLSDKATALIQIRENKLKELAGKYGLKLNTLDINKLIDWGKKNKQTLFVKDLEVLSYNTKEGIRASYAPLRNYYSDKQVDKMESDIKSYYDSKGNNVKMSYDFGNGYKSKNLSPNELKGKKLGEFTIKEASIVNSSTLPVIVSENFKENYLQSTVRMTLVDSSGNEKIMDYDGYSSMDMFSPSSSIIEENIKLNNKNFK